MRCTIDDQALRQLAQAKLKDGSLPSSIPASVLAGQGSGNLCALCGHEITRDDVEYDVEQNRLQICLHVRCHGVWERAVSGWSAGSGLPPHRSGAEG